MAFADEWGDMADDAIEMLKEDGAPVTLPRETGSTYNPVTGVTTPGVDASVSSYGLILPYPASLIDGTRIKATDRQLLLDPTHEPLMTDLPQMAGESLGSIVGIKSVECDNATPVVYFCQVRV